jgi:hypothetical protein
MYLDGENETDVTKTGTAPEPALAAENASAGGEPGAAPASSSSSSSETLVSAVDDSAELATPIKLGDIRLIVVGVLESIAGRAILAQLVADWLLANPPTIGVHQMEELTEHAGETANTTVQEAIRQLTAVDLPALIDAAKADILAHLTPLITAIVAKQPAPALAAAAASPIQAGTAHTLAAGDPVRVWADPEHKAFREGSIVEIHDGAHAFDVKLDDGTVTKIGADGLEYDDRR